MPIIEHAGYYENPLYNVSHTHTSCELMCVVSGEVRVSGEADGEEIALTGGSCLLIKSRQKHNVLVNHDLEYKRFIAVINPWELKNQLVRPDLFTLITDKSKSGFIRIEKPKICTAASNVWSIFSDTAGTSMRSLAPHSPLYPEYTRR